MIFWIAFLSIHTMDKELDDFRLQWLSDNALAFKFFFIFVIIWILGFISGIQRVSFYLSFEFLI